MTCDRRKDRQIGLRRAPTGELGDLLIRDGPQPKPVSRSLDHLRSLFPDFRQRAVLHLFLRAQGKKVLVLRGNEVRAVQGEERLAFADELPGVIYKQILDPS